MSTQRAPERLFLKGIPDNHLVKTHVTEPYSHQQFTLPGTAAFLTELHDNFSADPSFCCPPALPPNPSFKLPRLPLVNYMAEGDRYRGALKVAEWIVNKTGLPCFNHPAAVAATTRDGVSRTLQGIPGLIVPTTVRFKPAKPQDFPETAEKAGLKYPVMVRLTGTQTGSTLIRIDNAREWGKIFAIPWGGCEVYLTQFHECADSEGHYRKTRIAVIGNEIIACHQVRATQWLTQVRVSLREGDDDEGVFLERFDTETLPKLEPAIRSISNRLQLDYFGMDLCLQPDESMVLFEATGSMSLLKPARGRSDILATVTQRLSTTLVRLLQNPKGWRHPGTPAQP